MAKIRRESRWSMPVFPQAEAVTAIKSYLDRQLDCFGKEYCQQEWSSKLVLGRAKDTRQPALNLFSEMEYRMWLVNNDDLSEVRSYLSVARGKIDRLFPDGSFGLDHLRMNMRYTSGASFHQPYSPHGIQDKYGDHHPTVTLACAPIFRELIRGTVLEKTILGFKLVRGSRISTVPKNLRTDRTIEINPSGNVYCQKAAAGVIRRHLKRVSIDLDDQSPNRDLALKAVARQMATLDLSSASDTISLSIAREILPYELYELLLALRCDEYLLDSEWREAHKLSSMGNACTFEVETLIFWSLVWAVYRLDYPHLDFSAVRVYGDDVICHQEAAQSVMNLFERCGFIPNAKKSFLTGQFFESCGLHSYQGSDVTPFYVRTLALRSPVEVLIVANKLRRWSLRIYGDIDESDPIWDFFRRYLPPYVRHTRIPDGFGDGALVSLSPVGCSRNWVQHFRVVVARVKRADAPPLGGLICALHLGCSEGALSRFSTQTGCQPGWLVI